MKVKTTEAKTMWTATEREEVQQKLAVVSEVVGAPLSAKAKNYICDSLTVRLPASIVLVALDQCAAECSKRLTLADILMRAKPLQDRAKTQKFLAEQEESVRAVAEERKRGFKPPKIRIPPED